MKKNTRYSVKSHCRCNLYLTHCEFERWCKSWTHFK